MVDPEPCKEPRRRISAAIYGWDRPLTFTSPGFEQVAQVDLQLSQRLRPVRFAQFRAPGLQLLAVRLHGAAELTHRAGHLDRSLTMSGFLFTWTLKLPTKMGYHSKQFGVKPIFKGILRVQVFHNFQWLSGKIQHIRPPDFSYFRISSSKKHPRYFPDRGNTRHNLSCVFLFHDLQQFMFPARETHNIS